MSRKCCITNCFGNYDYDSKEKDSRIHKNKEEIEK